MDLTPDWPATGLLDLALDPDFARNHQIFFTIFGFDHGMISGLDVVRATFNQASNSLSNVKIIFRNHPQTPNDARSGMGTRQRRAHAIGAKDGYLYIDGRRPRCRQPPSPGGWRRPWTPIWARSSASPRDGAPAPGNPFAGQDLSNKDGARARNLGHRPAQPGGAGL